MRRNKTKKIAIILIIIIAVLSLSVLIYAATVPKTIITCVDAELYKSLKTTFSSVPFVECDDNTNTIRIPTENVNNTTELNLSKSNISDITGLQVFVNLSNLDLSGNNITNISSIANLTNLRVLNLSNNSGVQLNNMLINQVNLTQLYLSNIGISNIQCISGLINLEILDLSSNGISNLSSLNSLEKIRELNISNNENLNTLNNILVHNTLTKLNISNTRIASLDGIKALSNLVNLNVRNIDGVSLSPIVEKEIITNGEGEEAEQEEVAYLNNLKILDISYTTGLAFSELNCLTKLEVLYMQGNGISSITDISTLQNLDYINLDENNISDISPMIVKKTEDNIETIESKISATQIILRNNKISDISVLGELKTLDSSYNISYLDLSNNNLSNISPLERYGNESFEEGLVLKNQKATFKVFDKTTPINQYIILPNIVQESKNSESIIYTEENELTFSGVTLNTSEESYQNPENLNIIITPETTENDILTVKINGGPADGSLMTYKISKESSAMDSLVFSDSNLGNAIYQYFLSQEIELDVIPKILNITNNVISSTSKLDLSAKQITDLRGLSNFNNLEELNLSDNNIPTIDELQYCTKIKKLNLSNSPINNNNTAIEKMQNLTYLNLSGTGMTNINSINNLIEESGTSLEELYLSNNSLNDVNGIQLITSLKKLYIANNNISDISKFSSLKNLDTIKVADNQIEDITSLTGLNKLKLVYLNNNKIKDIVPISGLLIDELDISRNQISDISSISKIKNLKKLYMNNNKISDITALSEMGSLINLNMSNNRISNVNTIETLAIKESFVMEEQKILYVLNEEADENGNIEIELPEIFKSAQKSNSKIYTEEDIEFKKCSLSEEEEKENIIIVNTEEIGNEVAEVTIKGGKAKNTKLYISLPLKPTITYNITEPTNGNIIATISFNRNDVTILNNEGKDNYTFTDNGEFVFEYIDKYGFEGTAKANVDLIDRQAPGCTVSKEIIENKIKVTIEANEIINILDGWTMAEDHLSASKIYEDSIEEIVRVSDILGNYIDVEFSVEIDKTSPVITGVIDGQIYNQAVTPIIQDDNLASITLIKNNDSVAINYTSGSKISQEGTYKLTAVDTFGNTTIVNFTIQIATASDEITSTNYTVDEENKIINKITPNTTLQGLKSNISNEMSYQVLDGEGNVVSDTDKLGTGYQLKMENDKIYTIVVLGDLNGDASINILDIARLQKIVTRSITASGLIPLAANINDDTNINLLDLAKLQKIITGQSSL